MRWGPHHKKIKQIDRSIDRRFDYDHNLWPQFALEVKTYENKYIHVDVAIEDHDPIEGENIENRTLRALHDKNEN